MALLGGERGRLAGLLFVPAVLASLVSGRAAFTLGVGAAAGAVLAAARGRTLLAAAAGFATALCSPVAALFAAMIGAALAAARPPGSDPSTSGDRRLNNRGLTPIVKAAGEGGEKVGRGRAGVALAVAATLPTLFLIVAFPEGGTFPFVPSAFWPTFAAAVAVAVFAPKEWRAVRVAGVLYAVLALAAFAIPTPIGGNASRLGTLVAAPVAVLALWPRHKLAVALLALPIAYWILQPPVRDVLRAKDDPSTQAAFYEPILGFLEERQPARVEVPFTQNHGEAFHLARHLPIARGWNRQLDRERNALFYEDDVFTPRALRRLAARQRHRLRRRPARPPDGRVRRGGEAARAPRARHRAARCCGPRTGACSGSTSRRRSPTGPQPSPSSSRRGSSLTHANPERARSASGSRHTSPC